MQEDEILKIAIAETSMIVRSGLALVLKRIQGLKILPIELAGQEVLSSREKEIITCVVKGMTNKEIADALYLSAHTVITHRRNIARKLQIHSPAGLTIYAIVNKLVELQDIKEYL